MSREDEFSDFLDAGGGLAATAKSRECPVCARRAAAQAELLDGIKRRIGSALVSDGAGEAWLSNSIRSMQRFIIEWEKRHGR